MRITNWTKLSSAELYQAWCSHFASEPEALAEAIWAANRMVKDKSAGTKAGFYAIKDAFIQKYSLSGQFVRSEPPPPTYHGNRGVTRTLYCHNIKVGERTYRLHSYQTPANLSEGQGEDKEKYGGQFTPDEWKLLPLPFSGLYKMLGWYAGTQWQVSARGVSISNWRGRTRTWRYYERDDWCDDDGRDDDYDEPETQMRPVFGQPIPNRCPTQGRRAM